MNLAQLLARSARAWSDRPAVALGGDPVLSYRALADRAARIAAGLRDIHGLRPGDRVALAMTNTPDYVEALFAAWHGGFAAVPINAKLHPREFAYILGDSGARVCIATEDVAEAVAGIAGDLPELGAVIAAGSPDCARLRAAEPDPMAEVAPDDLAWLFYTSGTTGRPKGAMLSHRNLLIMTLGYFADVDQVGADSTIVHAAPMSHGSGMYLLPHIAKGGCQVIPESRGFSGDEFLALLPFHQNVTAFFAPTMVTRLVNAPSLGSADLSNLRTIVYGGGPMYAEDCLRALDALGPCMVQIYGQGESPMTITGLSRAAHLDRGHPRYMERLASVGIARTDVEVRVCDGDDADVAPGEVGEVLVRGDVVMTGYWRNPDATAETLRGGWLHTGDMGAFDEDGYLTLKDRSKDLIISGGSNIYPREVEEVLLRHPGVLEVSVIGRPHHDMGEQVVAYVVPRAGEAPEAAALDALCIENMARFKRPRVYRFIDALPKNNYGKVLKTELREAESGAGGQPPARTPGARPASSA